MNYILFESKAPSELVHYTQATLAVDLVESDHQATLVLIQDGVFWTSMRPEMIERWTRTHGIEVLVDGFSLKVRGLRDRPLPKQCKVCETSDIIQRLAQAQVKAIWR